MITYHGEQDLEPIHSFACVTPSTYSSSKPSGISGTWSSSDRLQIGQGMPGAPHPHPL
jgi:hypothetical protein